jgi:hypothetical protein
MPILYYTSNTSSATRLSFSLCDHDTYTYKQYNSSTRMNLFFQRETNDIPCTWSNAYSRERSILPSKSNVARKTTGTVVVLIARTAAPVYVVCKGGCKESLMMMMMIMIL